MSGFLCRLPALALGCALAAASGSSAAAEAPQPPATPRATLGDVPGTARRVIRGYADTPLGQVHWQDVRPTAGARPGAPVYVLLHQVPWFHIYYNGAQAELAARGLRSLSIDLPGYGLSARPESPPAIGDYALAVEAALRALRIRRAVVVGHHTGATVGAELARRAPARVGCLVMHGVPLYTPEQAAARLAAPHWDPTYRADGAHLADRWTYLSGRVAGSPAALHWSVLSIYLAGEREWFGHHAVFRYDMATTLRALQVPAVVLTNRDDLLDFTFERVRELRPDFGYRRLEAGSSNMAFDEPAPWTEAVVQAAEGC
jgi:pimeloyl-ACP methyl ester carboxylesterase